MSEPVFGLRVVDGYRLGRERYEALRPGEDVSDRLGHIHRLPRFFYRVESWERARELKLTEHFSLAELIKVDCREVDILVRHNPHYIPCAVVILARYLEAFRQDVNAPIFVAANGGYRSPAHKLSKTFGPHNWAAAADIYRVGDTFLDNRKEIEKYRSIFSKVAPEVHIKPFGVGKGETDDHLHIDIGYVTHVPHHCDEAG